jgi:hypothetical protein
MLGAETLPGGDAKDEAPQPEYIVSPLNPFEFNPADEGALLYEDLAGPGQEAADRETRASVDAVQTWAETQNGPAVHAAWSRYTDAAVNQAQIQRAEHEAGLANIGNVGVR